MTCRETIVKSTVALARHSRLAMITGFRDYMFAFSTVGAAFVLYNSCQHS